MTTVMTVSMADPAMSPFRLDPSRHRFHTKVSIILTMFFFVSLLLISLVFGEHGSKAAHRLLEEQQLQDQPEDYSDYSCNQLFAHTVAGDGQCLFARTCNGGVGVFAPFVFCHSTLSPSTWCWIISPILAAWLIVLFRMLGSTAEDFFSPSLEMFSVKLGLPPRFAGVTLLALGNGAADVSATVNAIVSDPQNGYQLSLGALTGAAMFVGAVVAGIVMILANGVPCRGALVRDVTALLLTVLIVSIQLERGEIGPAAISLFCSMYLFFVFIVLIADIYHRAVVLPRLRGEVVDAERQRQLDEGQRAAELAGDALNTLAEEQHNVAPERRHESMATHAVTSVLEALSNYSDTVPAGSANGTLHDGWGLESDGIFNDRPVHLHGANGLLTKKTHGHEHPGVLECHQDMPYTSMMEDGLDRVCTQEGSFGFGAANWRGAWHDGKQELQVHFQQVWDDIFVEDNNMFDKVLLIGELPFVLVRKLTVPIPCEGYYCRALVALSIIVSPFWLGYYLWSEHDTNMYWSGGASVGAYFLLLCVVIGALVMRFAPGGDGIMALAISAPIALYGFIIAATWIDAIAAHLVNLLDFLGIVCRIPGSIMGLTVLAWGNSMGDLSANMTMARKGLANMAITACFAGPVFNILIGLGLGFSSLTAVTGKATNPVTISPSVLTGIIFITTNTVMIIVTGLFFNKGKIPKEYGYVAIGLYMTYVVISVLLQFSKYGDH